LETFMRAVILPLIALAGVVGFAVPVQATLAVPHHEFAVAAPAITTVRQRCGEGTKREKAWQDKSGAWHGKCVPKR
jgi:hypothetical protein